MRLQSFQGWQQDLDFARKLDVGWNLETVREAAYKALATVGRDSMHFRPPEEQNDHKITCGVRTEVLHQVDAPPETDSLAKCRPRHTCPRTIRWRWYYWVWRKWVAYCRHIPHHVVPEKNKNPAWIYILKCVGIC